MTYFPLVSFLERAAEVRPTLGEGNEAALAIYDKVIASVDRDAIVALQEKYRDRLVDFDPVGIYKYADVPFWVARFVTLAQRLGFDRMPPVSLLDIGTGSGHFLAVAQALGHRPIGTDIDVPVYGDIARALGVDRRIAPVVRGKPYPDVGGPFDRVTIFWQVFDYIRSYPDGSRDYWSLDDWKLLMTDIARNHCAPDGQIHMELNVNYQFDRGAFNEPLMAFCEDSGATVDRQLGYVDLPAAGLRTDPVAAGRDRLGWQ